MSDEGPRIIFYKARGFSPKFWSQADGFGLSLVGVLIFGVLTWVGFYSTLPWILVLSVPILAVCLILLVGDAYYLWQEKRPSHVSVVHEGDNA